MDDRLAGSGRDPTLGDGETYQDLLQDRAAFEDYDLGPSRNQGYGSPVSVGSPCNNSSAPAEMRGEVK